MLPMRHSKLAGSAGMNCQSRFFYRCKTCWRERRTHAQRQFNSYSYWNLPVMKRILNMNEWGLKSLSVIGIFLVLLPAGFYGITLLLGPTNPISQVMLDLAKTAALIGAFLLAA